MTVDITHSANAVLHGLAAPLCATAMEKNTLSLIQHYSSQPVHDTPLVAPRTRKDRDRPWYCWKESDACPSFLPSASCLSTPQAQVQAQERRLFQRSTGEA